MVSHLLLQLLLQLQLYSCLLELPNFHYSRSSQAFRINLSQKRNTLFGRKQLQMDCSSAVENQGPLLAELAHLRNLLLLFYAKLTDHSSVELCKSLAPMMLTSIERSICMAKSGFGDDSKQSYQPVIPDVLGETPYPASQSPRSESSCPAVFGHREICNKRKTLPKWTKQLKIGAEGIDDCYSWRKYGQKDILGAKHPRGYYRCTHRHNLGCLATKQVQRSDTDPLAFDVTYHGSHTCLQQPKSPLTSPPQELLSFRPDIKIKPEDLVAVVEEKNSLSFSFGSLPVTQHIFSSTCTTENGFSSSLCPNLLSSVTTSEPLMNYISVASPCRVSSGSEGLHNLYTSVSDLAGMMPTNNSATDSPAIYLGLLESLDFSDFQFDESSFFS